jgi:hypothetical protein
MENAQTAHFRIVLKVEIPQIPHFQGVLSGEIQQLQGETKESRSER